MTSTIAVGALTLVRGVVDPTDTPTPTPTPTVTSTPAPVPTTLVLDPGVGNMVAIALLLVVFAAFLIVGLKL